MSWKHSWLKSTFTTPCLWVWLRLQTSILKFTHALHSFPASSKSPVSIPTDESNLVVKAARLLQSTSQTSLGANLVLHKRIPIEAGMGGGSSDAAATLVGLNQLWSLGLSVYELEQLAAQLGSDIPFFINSHTAAICRGRGEQISSVPVRCNFPIVIVQPSTGLSTPKVFKEWSEKKPTGLPCSVTPLKNALAEGNHNATSSLLYNALQIPAARLNTQVLHLMNMFQKFSVNGSLMTGSGSACFGLCRSVRQATSLASRLRAARMGRVYVASFHP